LSRGDLTDSEWRILDPLLPDRGDRGPPISDKRRIVNGILWVLRTGAPWRDLPERYGNWNSVFVRFTRWSKIGVWEAAFETLASLGPPADKEHAIDSTIVRAHQHAAGLGCPPVDATVVHQEKFHVRMAAFLAVVVTLKSPTGGRIAFNFSR
jgi:transposase